MATRLRIGLRQIRALQPGQTLWDSSLPGFGARRQQGEAIAYVLKYRTAEGRQRWFTIGQHGAPWTPESARQQARQLLGDVARKADPAADKRAARKAQTISELCDLYLADAEAGRLMTRRRAPKKVSTLATDRGRILRHIKPLLGRRTVGAVTREDVEVFMHDVAVGKTAGSTKTKPRGLARVRGGRGTATRTVGLLGAIFAYAVRHRMRADNPVHGVTRFADGKRQRRLSDDEYKAFGDALRQANTENIWPAAIAAARFLALTGWRSGEALGLRCDEVDLARRTAMLRDTKTGLSMRPLSHAACDAMRSLSRSGGLVFPATRGNGDVIMSGFKKLWKRIAKLGGLPPDVTPHVLRHSFASLAADLGYSEPVIAALVGHQGRSTTSRYLHSADTVLLAAADAVANRTAQLMGEHSPGAQVVPLSARRDGLPMALKETDDVSKVPDWVPAPVARLAHLMHEDATKRRADAESIELVRRLTCDPRMKRVWNELLRRKRANYRTTEAFLHPVRSGPQTFWAPEARARRRRAEEIRTLADGEARAEVKKLEKWALLSEFAGTNYIFSGSHIFSGYEGPKIDRQQHALAFLFHEAFRLALQKPQPMSRTDAQTARSLYLPMAKRIAADNTERQRLHGFPDERLSEAACAYLELADEIAPAPGSPLLVERKHERNELIKGFVLEFTSTTTEIFGEALFRTVATFANVALNRDDLTGEQVRKLVAFTPRR